MTALNPLHGFLQFNHVAVPDWETSQMVQQRELHVVCFSLLGFPQDLIRSLWASFSAFHGRWSSSKVSGWDRYQGKKGQKSTGQTILDDMPESVT